MLQWKNSSCSPIRIAQMGTHTENKSSFERRGRVARHWLKSNRRFGSSTTVAIIAVKNRTDSTDRLTERTCGVQTKRASSNETHRVEDAHNAKIAKIGRLRIPQSIDSRQSGRPHDHGHDSRETDQVWTCSELARVILHRLGPTCTITSIAPTTTTLTVFMNTVNSSQNHRLTAYLGTRLRQDRRCE